MSTIYLIDAAPDDLVPGRELADPDCPQFPGLLDRPDVKAWLSKIGYGYTNEGCLVYLLTEDDPGMIPAGFEYLTIEF